MRGLLKRVLAGPEATSGQKPQAGDDRKVDWKAKATEASARAKAFEAEAREQAKRAGKLKASLDKLHQREAEFDKVRERLALVERELNVAREHLMAVEVKLDILEGAANVLDARTRTAIRSQLRETGAPV